MAGLFAAEDVAALEHFFENVAITNISAGQGDIFAGEDTFEAEIGHGGGDNAIARQFILGFEITRDGEKNAIPVDNGTVRRDKESAIGVAIKGDTECGAFDGNALLQFFEVERAAACVDIAAIGLGADADYVTAEG